jgi:signal peptidase
LVKVAIGLATLAIFGAMALLSVPSVTGLQSLVVLTGSMGEEAPAGSLVVGRPLDARDVKRGDVIVARRAVEGRVLLPVMHRVIERRIDDSGEVLVRTKGDANRAPDPGEYILRGTTLSPVLVIPRLGRAVTALRTPVGWFGFVVFPALLAGALWLRKIWKRGGNDDVAGSLITQNVDSCAYAP